MNPTCGRDNCEGCPGRYLCHCLGVTEEAVLDALATGSVRNVRDLRSATGAGDGCMACHGRLRQYIERHSLNMVAIAS